MSIDIIVRDLKFRHWDLQTNFSTKRYYDQDHITRYNGEKEILAKLVKAAKSHECPYNPEADVEINRGYKFGYPVKSY
ncbi:MAG: hypothetical protein HZT40_19665 [Candidatus Thiothrix singaporensis]|uniref:Uncharacterized protein n=1 Tax=Candidatus Thiothrix singaporensis TaxID=2799669 RepID=A0A7L6AWS4_9GAMM|nr:MAG: hypothetical protein HZT40_19665 [Candidatus Thiothrix singaporensis]